MFDDYKGIAIFAPHPKDELIGAFDVLKNNNNEKQITIVYGPGVDNEMQENFLKLKEYFSCNQLVQNIVPPFLTNKESLLYFPDPVNEIQPEHRKWGLEGEYLARRGFNVVFYTIRKNVPYIYKTDNMEEKEKVLNEVYPNCFHIWNQNRDYILYEGYNRWLF